MACRNIWPRMQVSYVASGNTAEDVNTVFLRKGCSANAVECDSELVQPIGNLRKKLEQRKIGCYRESILDLKIILAII